MLWISSCNISEWFLLTLVICGAGNLYSVCFKAPLAMLKMQPFMLEFIGDQLYRLVPCLSCIGGLGHSCGMQSFTAPVDHYAALLCNLQRAQWVFEQFPSTLKAALPPVWVFAYLLLCAESSTPPLTTPASNTYTTHKLFSDPALVFLLCCSIEKVERSTLWGSEVKQSRARENLKAC